MSINKLKNKLELASKKNRLPKILIPVHLAGTSCDTEEISKLSKKYNFKVIEDASHAMGGKYKNKYSYILNKLDEKGIKVQLHYLPIHLHPYYGDLGFQENQFPISEEYAKTAISLPLYPELDKNELQYTIKNILNIFNSIG